MDSIRVFFVVRELVDVNIFDLAAGAIKPYRGAFVLAHIDVQSGITPVHVLVIPEYPFYDWTVILGCAIEPKIKVFFGAPG